MSSVVDVPRLTMASFSASGSASIVAGLSPVNGKTWHRGLNPYRATKYPATRPTAAPASVATAPSFARRSSVAGPGAASSPATSARSPSCQRPARTSQRFVPPASATSMGAMRPAKTEARNEDTSETLAVAA